jgi:transposase-like protein
MATLVRQWETSGEPRRAFARRHGLTVSQFDYWKRQVRRAATTRQAVGFAPVQVVEQSQGRNGASIELELAGGERVTIHEGASLDLVRTVVAALRPSC